MSLSSHELGVTQSGFLWVSGYIPPPIEQLFPITHDVVVALVHPKLFTTARYAIDFIRSK